MPQLDLKRKLSVLADAAKYDASCASSAAPRRNSLGGKGVGSTEGSGICHAYAPDGRCISLLKVLLTNYCMYDCVYCVNRISSNVQRARFRVSEIVELTLDFYRRNYIEGLFLSSGIIRSPNYTMEQMIAVARSLREDHDFRGYIHLKSIPEADQGLIEEAGRFADRLSINVELPSEASLERLAPEKRMPDIRRTMGRLRLKLDETRAEKRANPKARKFATGQSTQVIVGADAATDADILRMSTGLYANYDLKRVYYSAFSPIPDSSSALPLAPPPLMREHRLYQADWLYRFYGFTVDEIVSAAPGGHFDPAVDPKLAWALANRALFPVDVNRAPREMLLRVPGVGAKTAERILATRRHQSLRLDDLKRLSVSLKTALPFLTALDWKPGAMLDEERLKERLAPAPRQLSLF
jgi:putative DNA modification/repair radical SAM protein